MLKFTYLFTRYAMEFNITEDNKIKIGKLIHYYRMNTSNHISQNKFLKNKYNENICSRQTLSKIEKGIIIKQDSIYEELIQNLNLKYNTKFSVEELITEEMCTKLLYACDYYQLDSLVQLSSKYMKQLEPYTQYILFNEYYLCLYWIYTYYTIFKLPTLNDSKFIISLKDIINPNLYEVMMDLVFKCNLLHGNYTFYYFDYEHANSFINRANYAMILNTQSRYNEMLKICRILEKECIRNKNIIRLLDLYTTEGFGLTNTELVYFNSIISKTTQLLEENKKKIPRVKINQFYKNIGLQSFRLKEYKTCIQYLEKFIDTNSVYTNIIGIDLCIAYQYTNNIRKLKNFIKDKTLYCGNSQYELLLNYFIYKYNMNYSYNQLSDFIVNEVPSIIDNTMATFKDFFYDELTFLVDQTKRYKDLKDFLDATNNMLPK